MANSTDQVLVGVPHANGGVFMSDAPLTVADYPDDATTALPAAMKQVGFVTEDGVTESVSRNIEKIKAWGGQVVRTVQQDYETSYSFGFLQFKNLDVLRATYGTENVTATTAGRIQVKKNSRTLERRSFTFEMLDGDNRVRVFIPNGQITEVGDVTYDHKAAIVLDVTVEAFPDESGNNAYIWTDDLTPTP